MTAFFWVDTIDQAEMDAVYKDASKSWVFCDTVESLKAIDIADYDFVYMKTGLRDIEREFANIMSRNAPKW